MANSNFYKNYQSEGEIAPYRICALAEATKAKQATSATDILIGTTDELGKQTNNRVDVCLEGLPEVEAGASINLGDPLTADTQGRAIKATLTGERIIGFSLMNGTEGDIIEYKSNLSFFATTV